MSKTLPVLSLVLLVSCAWLLLRADWSSANSGSGLTTESNSGLPVSLQKPEQNAPPLEAGDAIGVRTAEGPVQESGAEDPEPLPLRAQLLDERTGEAVPQFPITVYGPDAEGEEVVTDDEGRFSSSSLHLPGVFELSWDDPDASLSDYYSKEVQVTDLQLEQRLDLHVGPTYRIAVDPPAGHSVTSLVASVTSRPERASFHSRLADDSAHLRSGDTPWIRLHPEDVGGGDSGGPWTLDVSTEDGLWWGSAEVTKVIGVYSEIVPIELEPVAAVSISLDTDKPLTNSVPVTLVSATGERVFNWGSRSQEVVIRALRPGPWTLTIDSPNHVTVVRELTLVAGELHREVIRLEPVVPIGAISGRVVSATGMYHESTGVLRLWGVDGGKGSRVSDGKWVQQDGRWILDFAFKDLPAGRYLLRWLASSMPYDMTPERLVVEVPSRGVELRIEDDIPMTEFVLHVVDANTGEPVESFDVWWKAADRVAGWKRAAHSGEVLTNTFTVDRDVVWVVRAPGHKLAGGDLVDLRKEEGRRVGRVRLESGWGAQFFVSHAETNEYLEGIVLTFDGEQTGATDANGRLPVALTERPDRLGVATPGWKLAGGNVDPVTGSFDDDNWWAEGVQLLPTDG